MVVMAIQTTPFVPKPNGLPSGFKLVDSTIKRRMVLSVEGDWGTGKTDLALTAPGPIAFFKFDLNADVTLAKYANAKQIYKREYDIPDSDDPKARDKAEAVIRTFQTDYAQVLGSGAVRSIIWDTATEIWEQIRLASFGRLTNIMPHHYVQVNNSFRGMIRAAFDSDV